MDSLQEFLAGADQAAAMDALSEIAKSIGVSTTGFPVRENLSGIITAAVPIDAPVRRRLARKPGTGTAVAWKQITSLGSGGGAFAEGSLPTAGDTVYADKSAAFKSIGRLAEVTLQAIGAGRNFTDQKLLESRNKSIAVIQDEEDVIINGDSSSDSNEFDGLLTQITTNVTDMAGAALTWAALMDACQQIYDAGGLPRMIVASPREVRTISSLVWSKTTVFQSTTENQPEGGSATGLEARRGSDGMTAGMAVTNIITDFGPVEVVMSRKLALDAYNYGDLLILDHESVVEAGNDNGNAIEMHDCVSLERVELPLSGTTWRWLIWEFTTLVLRAEMFQAKIQNIGAS